MKNALVVYLVFIVCGRDLWRVIGINNVPRLVPVAEQAAIQSSQLDFRPRLDHPLRDDRHRWRANMVAKPYGRTDAALGQSDAAELPLVADVLRHAEPGRRPDHHRSDADLHHRFIILTSSRDRLSMLLFIPYAAWVGFAALLNASILYLN